MSHPNPMTLPSWAVLKTRPKDSTSGVQFSLDDRSFFGRLFLAPDKSDDDVDPSESTLQYVSN